MRWPILPVLLLAAAAPVVSHAQPPRAASPPMTDGARAGVDPVSSLRVEGGARSGRARLRLDVPKLERNRMRVSFDAEADGAATLTALIRIDGADGLLYVGRHAVPLRTGGRSRHEIDTPAFDAAARVSLVFAADAGTVRLQDFEIDGASSLDLPPPTAAARRYVDYALDVMERHSLHRAGVDWQAFRRAVLDQARGARTAEDAHFAVRYAVGLLGDTHGWLRAADRAEALGRAPVSNARTGRPPVEPEGRVMPGGAAYISVPGFAGGSHSQQVEFAEALQALIRSLDGPRVCGWIVDLRGNSGGNLWPMLLGLGPLLGDGNAVVAGYPDGRREAVWHRDGKVGLGGFARLRVRGDAYRLQASRPRIAVLLGPDTASAGEVLAIAFRGAGETRGFGAPSAGATTGTRTFVLPDGAELVLSVVTMHDREGRPASGAIHPDEPTGRGEPERPLVEQRDVRAALDWAGGGC